MFVSTGLCNSSSPRRIALPKRELPCAPVAAQGRAENTGDGHVRCASAWAPPRGGTGGASGEYNGLPACLHNYTLRHSNEKR